MIYTQTPTVQINIAYQFNTKNQSFLDIHYYLKAKGIKNNAFFLALYDTDLMYVDPRDPRLNVMMKQKILKECMRNYWYFIREVVLIPDQGGAVGGGAKYKLHRGNLALNFAFTLNWNIFAEFPRQHGKTIAALVRYLWLFLFGTRNSEIKFFNKKLEDSKMNLERMRAIRAALPDYLRLDSAVGPDGKRAKGVNSVESISNPLNSNKITTAPSARNKVAANSLGRGCTIPFIYFDEYAFIPYNYIIYQSAIPAYSTASKNAISNNSPYGILITTTPGDLLTDEGQDAFETKNNAVEFSERFYDLTLNELNDIMASNTKSSFVYIKYTYKQLGSDEAYFDRMAKDMKYKWPDIRREVLLEWASQATNSPFDKTDLDTVETLIREPIREMAVYKAGYIFKVYKDMNIYKFPPIIGVDVSGGYSRDSSAITIVDSQTTEVAAVFNNNSIPIQDLANVIYVLVTKYMPNAVVNIERNGGFGASVLSYLLSKPEIKKNLYYEIKERVFEERFDGFQTVRTKKKVKVYGLDQTKATRDLLMEILRERMTYHKDKFVSRKIYEELCGLEVKRDGRIDHGDNGHDDTIFSYLLALYVFYEGQNIREIYGIDKTLANIKTEEFLDGEEVDGLNMNTLTEDISIEMVGDVYADEQGEDQSAASMIKSQMEYLNKNGNAKPVTLSEYLDQQDKKSRQVLEDLLRNDKLALKAYCEKYHVTPEEAAPPTNMGYTIPNVYFNNFYDENTDNRSQLQKEFDALGAGYNLR